MTTEMKILKWRLGKLPSPEEVMLLTKEGIITKQEAKEVLFNTETDDDRDVEELKSEIKFLRNLVEKLSSRTEIIQTIRTIEKPYYTQPWYQPYSVWCSATPLYQYGSGTATANNLMGGGSAISSLNTTSYTMNTSASGSGGTNTSPFSAIQTF